MRSRLPLAAGAILLVGALAAGLLSEAPEPSATVPEAVLAPHGNPPPPVISPDAPPGRTEADADR